MLPAIASGLLTAFLSILAKLATKEFFEVVLTKVIIFAAEKLAAMTTNSIDDELVKDIKERLGVTAIPK